MAESFDFIGPVASEVLGIYGAPRRKEDEPNVTKETVLQGQDLNNYRTRKVLDGGTHLLVVDHKEHLELVPQPLTPEEEAEIKAKEKFTAKVIGGTIGLAVGVFGFLAYLDAKKETNKPQVASKK